MMHIQTSWVYQPRYIHHKYMIVIMGQKSKSELRAVRGMSAKDTKTMSSRTQAKSQKSGEAIDFGQ